MGRQQVADLLAELGYSLQANRKTREGASPPDRHAPLAYINAQVKAFQQRRQPVVAVDTKTKAWVGDVKNTGREWRPQGQPALVRAHDWVDTELGQAMPYGVYDLRATAGGVRVGVDHDTAAVAVESLRRWWRHMGSLASPHATARLIMADGGGSTGSRRRLWKVTWQRLADEIGLRMAGCHVPPGTSQWTKIEHRLLSYIRTHWRGRPRLSHAVIVTLMANTTTEKGLKIHAELATHCDPTGIKVTDQELANVRLKTAACHGEWHDTIIPRASQK